jgi:hypothetical protein
VDYEECLHVYNLVNQVLADCGTPLELIARLVRPTQFRCHSRVYIKFGAPPCVDTALSLVPTTAHNAAQGTDVFMDLPSPALIQALAEYPIHPNVAVGVRLKSRSTEFSINTGVPHPTLQYSRIRNHQQDFDYFCKDLETLSSYAPAFACYRVMFPRGLHSNCEWDSLVAPTSVLKWVHQQQGGLPPKHLLGRAIKSLNQGGPYRRANNLRPSNLAAANATVIFALLNQPEFCESPDGYGFYLASCNEPLVVQTSM